MGLLEKLKRILSFRRSEEAIYRIKIEAKRKKGVSKRLRDWMKSVKSGYDYKISLSREKKGHHTTNGIPKQYINELSK